MYFQPTQRHTSTPFAACLRSCAVGCANVLNASRWISALATGRLNALGMGFMALACINRPAVAGINATNGITANSAGTQAYKSRYRYDSMEPSTR